MDLFERLAILYKKEKNSLIPYKVLLLDYDDEKKEYIVKDPDNEYYQNTQDDFSIIKCDAKTMITKGEVKLIECANNPTFYLYVFDESFVSFYTNKVNYVDEAYQQISKMAQYKKINLTLDKNIGNVVNYEPDHIWDNEEIDTMLYGEIFENNKNKEEEKDSKPEIDLLDSISKLDKFSKQKLYKSLDSDTKALLEEYLSKHLNGVDINRIIEDVGKKIIKQEDAIKTIATNIKFNQDLISKKDLDPLTLDSMKVAILLDGATGTGKTAIVKDIALKLDIPIVITNANSFSETGYVGPTITDILRKLIYQTGGDIKKAEKGIVFLDEIDKIVANNSQSGHNMKEGVQDELLTFISGGEYDIKDEGLNGSVSRAKKFDTSKLTFILAGAFQKLRERKIREQQEGKRQLGFSMGNKEEKKENVYFIAPEDYIKEGLKREFFGRIKVLVSTNSYSVEDLKDILLKSEISPLKNFELVVKMYGYKGITYKNDFIDLLASEAYNMGTGARALQTIMSGIQNKMLFDIMNRNYNVEEPINLTTKLIEDYKKIGIRKY